MQIMTVYRSVIAGNGTISALRTGDVHIGMVDQNDPRPNVLIECPESGEDYSHQGPSGLIDAHIRVTARGDTFKSATQLGEAIQTVLKAYTGTLFSHQVQLTEHFATMAGYDDKAKVFTHVSEYTSFYRVTS